MEGEVLGGRYRLGREIGAGGMGVVYEAVDETLGNRVAVKVLSAPKDAGPEAIARLEREARAAAALGHPNIVRVTDLGRTGEGAFLVMELLLGRSLDAALRDEGALEIEQTVRIHLQLLDALDAAHAAGVLHRDIKPANIFLTQLADGTELVKLLDFGLAYLLEEASSPKLTATGVALGTPAYMSPERLYGEAVDGRSDLYAVGVCLYEALAGELPFRADTPVALQGKILLNQPPDLRKKREGVSAALADVARRAMGKKPAERYASALAMSAALRGAMRAGQGAERSAASLEAATLLDLPSGLVAGDPSEAQTMAPGAHLAPASIELPGEDLAALVPTVRPGPPRAASAESPAPDADGPRPDAEAAGALETGALETGPLETGALETHAQAPRAQDSGALEAGALETGAEPAEPGATLAFGGVTRPPPASRGRPAHATPRTPRPAARRRTRGWLTGLGIGALLGVVVLGGLGAVVALRDPPAQPVTAAPPPPPEPSAPEPPALEPPPPVPAPAPPPEDPPVAPAATEPDPAPPSAPPRAPTPPRAHPPGRRASPPAPDSTPAPTPAPTPPPPRRFDPDQPLAPPGWD